MLTDLGVQGTTAKNYWDDLSSAAYSAKYVSDTNGSGIRINGDGLLDAKLVCDDSYRLANAYSWHEPKITLDEELVKQIADDVAKNLIKQKDPLEKNSNIDEVEVPQMSGFIEI